MDQSCWREPRRPPTAPARAAAERTAPARCAPLERWEAMAPAVESYCAARGLIPIDCAAAAYQLVDLNIATRRAGLRLRALALRLACDPRVLADDARLAARLARSFLRIGNLPALNRRIGDRRTLIRRLRGIEPGKPTRTGRTGPAPWPPEHLSACRAPKPNFRPWHGPKRSKNVTLRFQPQSSKIPCRSLRFPYATVFIADLDRRQGPSRA